jgi:cell wall-associated NlpC family hydrolase
MSAVVAGCAAIPDRHSEEQKVASANKALEQLKWKYAPDAHMAIFAVGLEQRGSTLVLTGEVDRAEAAAEAAQTVEKVRLTAANRITVLPSEELGGRVWGISCLSVASGREEPEHKAEMGTQVLMGHVVRIWKGGRRWSRVQSMDGYLSWVEKDTIVRCTEKEMIAWTNSNLAIVTAVEGRIVEQPETDARPVSDVVIGDLVKPTGRKGDWMGVQLPDGRMGFLPANAVQDYAEWKQARKPTSENIESTARMFLGRPYLWGGSSPKGLDCSGFAQLVFFLNGVPLQRNASEQARQGKEVAIDPDLSQARKGDLLFFGFRRGDEAERVTHVGIYLGDQQFIQSSQWVQVSSLRPKSPEPDGYHFRRLIRVRRVVE